MKIITLTNKGYIKYTDNLLASCIQNNVNLDIEICVMDKYTENYYSKKGLKTVLVSNENNKKFLKQDSKDFGKYMITKLDIIHTYLKNNSHVTYLDGDIVIKEDFIPYLKNNFSNYDLLIQNDLKPQKPNFENLCAGFMSIKSSEKTKEFFNTDNISKEEILTGLHDQKYINENKHLLNYLKLPLDLFPNGPHFYLYSKKLQPFIIHFNHLLGNIKRKKMKEMNEWYL